MHITYEYSFCRSVCNLQAMPLYAFAAEKTSRKGLAHHVDPRFRPLAGSPVLIRSIGKLASQAYAGAAEALLQVRAGPKENLQPMALSEASIAAKRISMQRSQCMLWRRLGMWTTGTRSKAKATALFKCPAHDLRPWELQLHLRRPSL